MSTAVAIISSVAAAATVVVMIALIRRCRVVRKKMKKKIIAKVKEELERKNRETQAQLCNAFEDVVIEVGPVEKFLNEILNEKPMRFSSEQLAACTRNFSSELGSGGFGVVYKGELPNGLPVAVKVLKVAMNRKVQEAFMAEVGTIGRTYHVHLVRLYGFCFDRDTKALVYEFVENGSLEKYLYGGEDGGAAAAAAPRLEWRTLHAVAVGTAKGIRYLHEECQHRIVHYDIKPANILLTGDFTPKVADFGLARLGERENTHMSLTGGGRGTPGYAAPELWMALPATEKCDVYSFGMVLFEVLGRRRNYDAGRGESREWFPRWVWERYEQGDMDRVVSGAGIEEADREKAEMMCKVALWCVQFQPAARPTMSSVVRMLEGEMPIVPPVNPFHYVMDSGGGSSSGSALWSGTYASSGDTAGRDSSLSVSPTAMTAKSTDALTIEDVKSTDAPTT
ncbi:hypothetical protein ACP4OV_025779 [Aristida adscensionis]